MDIRSVIRSLRIRARFFFDQSTRDDEYRDFQCNICGRHVSAPLRVLSHREAQSCRHCGSSRRFRSLMAALSEGLHGQVTPLAEQAPQKQISGLGMSDAKVYAKPLARIYAYTNTFYHRLPRLDITSIDPALHESADFIISSDVFEHVPPPVETSFANLHRLLKPGGLCVFSVPYAETGETREHFPDLYDYAIVRQGGDRTLLNKTRDGRTQVFDRLQFHGGGGATLEMRLFSKPSLLHYLANAGFGDIRIHDKDIPRFGIVLGADRTSLILTMRKV